MKEKMMKTDTPAGRHEFPAEKKIFSTAEAADYLGLTKRTMKHNALTEPRQILPDHVVSGTFLYDRESLDKWLQDRAENMDTASASRYLGTTVRRLQYYLYTMQPESERLKPDGYRGDRPYFAAETVEPFRNRKSLLRRQRAKRQETVNSS